jgi:hypothetical protein
MDDAFADGLRQVRSKKSGTVRTIAGALVLVDGDTDVQAINGGAANRDVTLPAVTEQNEGRLFEIWNIGATNSLVIKNAGGSTLFTLTFGHIAFARQIAGTWRAVGTVTNT